MKTPRLYVVGFTGKEQNALYSERAWVLRDESGGIGKMTLSQAKKQLEELSGDVGYKAIFKVVPIYKEKL